MHTLTEIIHLCVVDLDEMTRMMFDPVPSSPQVVPLNGKLQIRCRRPAGLPVPTVRWLTTLTTAFTNVLQPVVLFNTLKLTAIFNNS